MADLKKEVAGQPIWLWGVAAVVVVGGYLYIRSRSSSATPSAGTSTGGGGGGGGGKDTSSFRETIKDWQSSPTTPSPVSTTGPERKWLIHKTGSQHPWSFLSRHHERVQVGPTGSRKIVSK
jgi:hypothetical protein